MSRGVHDLSDADRSIAVLASRYLMFYPFLVTELT